MRTAILPILALMACVPLAAQGTRSRPSSRPHSTPEPIGVDEKGWPIFATDPGQGADSRARPVRSDFEAPPRNTAVPAAPAGEVDAEQGADSKKAADDPMRLDSPLRKIFQQIGYPSDLEDLKGVTALCRFTLRDAGGGEVGSRDVKHLADLRHPARDRLELGRSGGKVYGRDGAAVFASLNRMRMQSYEEEARDELELLGLLLRMPWAFGDGEEFLVEDESTVRIAGRSWAKVTVRRRQGSELGQVRSDRFELICRPDSMEPVEIHYTLASSGQQRRVRLRDYERRGRVRIPMRREFLDGSGKTSLVIDVLRLDSGQEPGVTEFRPLR